VGSPMTGVKSGFANTGVTSNKRNIMIGNFRIRDNGNRKYLKFGWDC